MSKQQVISIDGIDYFRANDVKSTVDTNGYPYVVVRSRDQGVMVGYLKEKTDKTVILLKARQVWAWESKFILVEFSEYGPTGDGRMSCELSNEFEMANWCGIYLCTLIAAKKIQEIPAFEAQKKCY